MEEERLTSLRVIRNIFRRPPIGELKLHMEPLWIYLSLSTCDQNGASGDMLIIDLVPRPRTEVLSPM